MNTKEKYQKRFEAAYIVKGCELLAEYIKEEGDFEGLVVDDTEQGETCFYLAEVESIIEKYKKIADAEF